MQDTYLTTAIPNLNFQYVEGRNKPKNGRDYFGSLFAFSFSRSNTISQGINKEHVEAGNGDTTVPASFFNLNNYIENVMMGALANFTLKLTNRSTISLKNAASINSDDRVIERIGYTGLSESEPIYSIGSFFLGFFLADSSCSSFSCVLTRCSSRLATSSASNQISLLSSIDLISASVKKSL